MSFKKIMALLALSIYLISPACAQSPTPLPTDTPSPSPIPNATATTAPTATVIPTQTPFYLTATVWKTDPVVPILLYHQFKTNRPSTLTTVSRLDLADELQKLYDSGYVTISLEKWLAGDLQVPPGKRPLVLSMDDLFYRNQIKLLPDGTPSDQTGLGLAWEFSQQHPDFGFHWALFSSLGDKPYGEGDHAEQQIETANAIVWCLEHDAMIYNHTFRHTLLVRTDGLGVTAELKSNDVYLRELLTLVNRQDLIPKLGNLFAMPYGKWPRAEDALTALYDYKNPEGLPLQAVFDVDFIIRPRFMPAPYSSAFDQWRIPRMVADLAAIDYLVKNKDQIPTSQSCKIGPLDESQSSDPTYLEGQIQGMIKNGQCPQGVYAMENFVFRATSDKVELIQKVK